MDLVKRVVRSRAVQESLGYLVASYLKFVQRTNRFVMEPADAYDRIGPLMPVIAAMWHGQHFMIHFAKRPEDRAASLVSRSGDGEFNAIALRHLGVRAIRGSGARGRGSPCASPPAPWWRSTSWCPASPGWPRATRGCRSTWRPATAWWTWPARASTRRGWCARASTRRRRRSSRCGRTATARPGTASAPTARSRSITSTGRS